MTIAIYVACVAVFWAIGSTVAWILCRSAAMPDPEREDEEE